jgi:hypothetical protein
MEYLKEGRPHLFLQQLFLVLNRHEASFSYGDVAFKDPDAEIYNVYGVVELELTQPVLTPCVCEFCRKAPKTITHIRLKHFRDYTLINLKHYPQLSAYSVLEYVSGPPRVLGCASRYETEQYRSLQGDTELTNKTQGLIGDLEFYNRKIRAGNELFLNFPISDPSARMQSPP